MFTPERSEPLRRVPGTFEQERRRGNPSVLGVGTLACPECDAPVGIGSGPLSPGSPLTCPFCAHHGPLRGFLSLKPPTRPTRVIVRVTAPARLRISPAD
ncbi:MAG TPA: hypothetical protein VG321_04220 [Solirubrobacteraceae bacterium]|nr:hypothetical protein [Solirubrobacteraceae bacterium]